MIKNHLPLGPEKRVTDSDEKFVMDVLSDKEATDLLDQNYSKLNAVCQGIIENYSTYGLEAITITSFDGNPLKCFGITDEKAKDSVGRSWKCWKQDCK